MQDALSLIGTIMSLNIGAITITTIIMNGWVKASHIKELKEELKELRTKTEKIEVFGTRLDQFEGILEEIKQILKEQRGK